MLRRKDVKACLKRGLVTIPLHPRIKSKMPNPPTRRVRHADPREAAEALFRKPLPLASREPEKTPMTRPAGNPPAKEIVSLRIDRDVLERFQEAGPGWQERINAALRSASER